MTKKQEERTLKKAIHQAQDLVELIANISLAKAENLSTGEDTLYTAAEMMIWQAEALLKLIQAVHAADDT